MNSVWQTSLKLKVKGKAQSSLYLVKEDLGVVRANIPDGHCRIKGIRKLHEIITKPNKCNGVFIREYAYVYVMSVSKVELKVVKLQSQINILDTTLMF